MDSSNTMLLLGVGSPFSDDTLGWELLDALSDQPLCVDGIKPVFIKADRPGAGILQKMQGYDTVVLIDALEKAVVPGMPVLLEPHHLLASTQPRSSHALGVAEALALGERLGMLPARLFILAMPMGAKVTPQAVEAAVAQLKRI